MGQGVMHGVFRFICAAVVCIASVSQSLAQTTPSAYQMCIACHGDKGQGNLALKAPALAGQHDWYLNKQLEDFSSQIRGSHEKDINGKQMLAFAAQLSDADAKKSVTGFLASLSPQQPLKGSDGDMKNGSRYYQAKCGACHGGKAEGNKAFNAPNLAILDADYLALQMKHFQQGVRGAHEDDRLGRQMAMMAKTISDEELVDVIYFITEQNK